MEPKEGGGPGCHVSILQSFNNLLVIELNLGILGSQRLGVSWVYAKYSAVVKAKRGVTIPD